MVVGTAASLLLSAGLIWSAVRFASQNPEEAGLGDSVFQVGRADRLARRIAADGPFVFPDPLERGRTLHVQHLGNDPDTGWLGVEARLPGDLDCLVEWDAGEERFVDCRGASYPPDGKGLTTYPGQVVDGSVSIDLRTGAAARAS